ncbi:hypothetical protein [Sciscionella marina]|uniref:hypothetical protein n=1 Tax=Sciscionella marina TaxID=508770 RepID=UPI0012F703F3|nr:hypothetical protein [Sciscionella marina]
MAEPGSSRTVAAEDAVDRLSSAASALEQRTKQMRAEAESGHLRIDLEDGRALHRTLSAQMDRINDWIERGKQLAAPLPFGAQWVGEAMSGKFSGRADGTETALVAVLAQYRDAVGDAVAALQAVLDGYAGAEDHNRAMLNKVPNVGEQA